jgi:P4 family phage/plasmid primase-like protien
VAQLHNKILNIASEIGARGTVCDEMFKKIVAHDYVMGDHKFGHPFSFRPVCKLIFATNNMPRTDDKTRAFYRRLLIIPLTKEFTDLDNKHKYYRTLLTERNGIFNWMVEGLKRLKERERFAVGKNMIETIESYRVENNPVLSFVDEHCVVDSNVSVSKRDIYEAYKQFCDDSGFRPVNIRKFGKELKRHLRSSVFDEHNSAGNSRMWGGIRLRDKHEYEDVRPF